MSQTPSPTLSAQIKSEIQGFLQESLQKKLDALKGDQDEQREKLRMRFQPDTWLASAAHRVDWIQQVTHALKFSHPFAQGTSLSSLGNPQANPWELGTHTLGENLQPDVVGNAAGLDVYPFLCLKVEGKTLHERAMDQDPSLSAALSDDPETAGQWMAAFANLAQPKDRLATHTYAKQVYWPLGQGRYHLLAPLFPTSLVHVVWEQLSQDRFSDESKAARQARHDQRTHEHGYCEYPNLAVQNFGGANAQNLGKLNVKRNGANWLLPSLPPQWQSAPVYPPLRVESIFPRRFGNRKPVKELTRILREFLESVEGRQHNNVHIHDKRAELVRCILDELLQFAAELQELDSDWSLDPNCKLNAAEQCWLNPKRAESDPEFAAKYQRGEWQAEVCLRFAQWLNASLGTGKLLLGLVESLAWQTLLDDELKLIRWELDHG
jgi:CRISPR-associated protein Csy1